MTENTNPTFAPDALFISDDRIWYPARGTKRPKQPNFSPDEDIEFWLKQNAPITFQQLADIRYVLYHRCSQSEFTVTNVADDRFDLTGKHSKLQIKNDRARHYLLWRLRLLGRSKKWIGALPKAVRPRG
jgi:hypothetical protein